MNPLFHAVWQVSPKSIQFSFLIIRTVTLLIIRQYLQDDSLPRKGMVYLIKPLQILLVSQVYYLQGFQQWVLQLGASAIGASAIGASVASIATSASAVAVSAISAVASTSTSAASFTSAALAVFSSVASSA